MSNLLKKLTLSLLSALVILFSFAPYFSVRAALTNPPPSTASSPVPSEGANWYSSGFGDWYSKVYDENVSPGSEIFGERYTAAQVQWVIYSVWAFVINLVIPKEMVSCVLTNTHDLTSCGQVLQSLLGQSDPQLVKIAAIPENNNQNLLGLVFANNRPFSGISYVKNNLQKFSLVPIANAAPSPGFGFDALKPVQNMWKATRDVAFGLFVLAAIIFAFMIMFRVKISPQVVISVQSAIPKLIIALILVTFSYAIAGFLVDLMYVAIGLVSLFGSRFLPFPTDPVHVFNFLTLGQPFGGNEQVGVFGLLFIYLALLPLAFGIVIFAAIGVLVSLLTGLLAAVVASAIIASIAGNILWIIAAILIIIIFIILIWLTIKIFWMLLKTFVNILLLTIFAPLQIVAGILIPSLGFGKWIKSFVTNLLTFIVAGVLILLMYVFLAQGTTIALDSVWGQGVPLGNFIANLIFGADITGYNGGDPVSNYWPPLLGSGNSGIGVGILLLGASFVIFTLIPKVSDIIASIIAGKPFAYGSAVGEAFNPLGMGSFAGKAVSGAASGFASNQIYNPRDNTGLIPTAINRFRNRPAGGANTQTGAPGGGAVNTP
jgi:hypothetical protein